MAIKLYRTAAGPVATHEGTGRLLVGHDWDELLRRDDLPEFLAALDAGAYPLVSSPPPADRLALVGRQEVWAAGVTYYRSRTARMEEAKEAGGSNFYDRVYHADRPELFLKATPQRVVGPGEALRLRPDSRWIVPEPELTLLVSPGGRITGFTVGNDLSCRDIEGDNPLYLPQAKTFDGCAALGPCIVVDATPPPPETEIEMAVQRGGTVIFSGSTRLEQMKKPLQTLVSYLFRAAGFPDGCFLMTGTGIVPPDDFSLQVGDQVEITIEPVGTLVNPIAPPIRPS